MKNGFKKIMVLVMALAMVFGSFGMAFAAEVPADVTGDALVQAVSTLMDDGAITGDKDGVYHPEQNLTRAQVSSIIVKLINPPAAELTGSVTVDVPDSGFVDMKGYGWAEPYINYMARNDIAKGIGGNMFAPGNNVTFAELVTFTVRAAGYTDDELGGTWPENYLVKGAELGLYENMGLVTETGAGPEADPELMRTEKATKEQAALLIYNARDEIKAANVPEDKPQGTDKDEATQAPELTGFVFADESFDSDMTAYAGKPLAKDVKVYVYGVEKDYSKSMQLSGATSDYLESNVYKYKSVSTPAWYKLEGGKITQIIVPGDVGFSGRIYCVINDSGARILNYEDKAVIGIDTLTAGREITWLGEDGFSMSSYGSRDYFDGSIFELYARDGEVRQVTKVGDSGFKGKVFTEIVTNGSFVEVLESDNDLVRLDGLGWYEVKENAAVYVLNEDDDAYEAGSLSSIKKGTEVRMYDISDDDEEIADIVVVREI